MGRRKGELTPAAVDRGWPHQIVLPAERTVGRHRDAIDDFCKDLSLCSRGHSLFLDKKGFCVLCFKEKAHAESFKQEFGGEWFDPKQRGRGRSWSRWRKCA